jgi:glycosyltransferase involved in cell wall biosynthesis
MQETNAITVSILSPCRNERRHIGRFLDSLLAQDFSGLDWEVLIADGMSDDGTREIIAARARESDRIVLIDNPGRIVSTGLNAALRLARGEIVLRMDVHTEYAPDYVQECVRELLRTGADNVGGPARPQAEGLLGRAISAAYCSRFSCGGALFHNAGYEGYVDTVTYGCWRRTTLERLGGFDESLIRNQDDELNMRLSRQGGRIWQTPRIRSWYRPRASLAQLFRQYAQYGYWKVAVLKKHPGQGSWRHLIPAMFLTASLMLPAASLAAAVAGLEAAATAALACWSAVLAAYLGADAAAAAAAARKHGWRLLPLLALVFPVYHLSYGAGFLAGSVSLLLPRGFRPGANSAFAQLTR